MSGRPGVSTSRHIQHIRSGRARAKQIGQVRAMIGLRETAAEHGNSQSQPQAADNRAAEYRAGDGQVDLALCGHDPHMIGASQGSKFMAQALDSFQHPLKQQVDTVRLGWGRMLHYPVIDRQAGERERGSGLSGGSADAARGGWQLDANLCHEKRHDTPWQTALRGAGTGSAVRGLLAGIEAAGRFDPALIGRRPLTVREPS